MIKRSLRVGCLVVALAGVVALAASGSAAQNQPFSSAQTKAIKNIVASELRAKEANRQRAVSDALKGSGVLVDSEKYKDHSAILTASADAERPLWSRLWSDPVALLTMLLVIATLMLAAVPLWQDYMRNSATAYKVASLLTIFKAGMSGFEQNPTMSVEATTGNWDSLIAEVFGTDVANALKPAVLRRVYLVVSKMRVSLHNITTLQNQPYDPGGRAEPSGPRICSSAAGVVTDLEEVLRDLPVDLAKFSDAVPVSGAT